MNLFSNEESEKYKKMSSDLKKVKKAFYRIKELGFLKDNRPNNKDGGIGNTFEDHLGVEENNIKGADFEGYEVKTQRLLTSSMISMFSKSPSHPKSANAYLKDTFGEIRDPKFNHKKLYASIFGHRDTLVYKKYLMRLYVQWKDQKVVLCVKDEENNILENEVYWTFTDLERASRKMKDLIVIYAKRKNIDGIRHYHYQKAKVYNEFNFKSFLKGIEEGYIQFDLRMGVYGSGKRIGKPHDHGSGFRIKRENFHQIFEESIELE